MSAMLQNVARSVASPRRRFVQQGIGRLTASAKDYLDDNDNNNNNNNNNNNEIKITKSKKTRLTQVSHKAPTRLVPISGKSSIERAGAAVCAIGSYGGGMLQGDKSNLSIDVESGSKLGVITQGCNRIYKRSKNQQKQDVGNNNAINNINDNDNDDKVQQHMTAHVDHDGFLVMAPDPCALFATSSFYQTQTYHLKDPSTSSLVAIDWFSAGRYRNGEQWEFSNLYSRTQLYFENDNQNIPFIQDAVSMTNNGTSIDPFALSQCNTFATIILSGPQAKPVIDKCLGLQQALASLHTRIRRSHHYYQDNDYDANYTNHDIVNEYWPILSQLAGRVSMGTSPVISSSSSSATTTTSNVHVVRVAATNNEDLYRIFHYCLLPLESSFGMQFYKDRISATSTQLPSKPPIKKSSTLNINGTQHDVNGYSDKITLQHSNQDPALLNCTSSLSPLSSQWSVFMLADSCLPTGSFAHSSGLEAAAQLGLLNSSNNTNEHQESTSINTDSDLVAGFIRAATRSALQQTMPFVCNGYQLGLLLKQQQQQQMNYTSDHLYLEEQYRLLQQQAHAVLATNTSACKASLDQGKSLARVAQQWLQPNNSYDKNDNDNIVILKILQDSSTPTHLGPIWGILGPQLQIQSQQDLNIVLGYCMARDLVSAAIRLSLVGPLASVSLLSNVQDSVFETVTSTMPAIINNNNNNNDNSIMDPLSVAASCAPVLEAVHPCHEILQVRLFRS